MLKSALYVMVSCMLAVNGSAQDSVWVKLRPKYDRVNGLHRKFFGENYRKEWGQNTQLPVIDLSKILGDFKPIKLGGGHQTVSLRLISGTGQEYVLRNIEKDASVLLPVALRKTFARDIVDDAMSSQHPFSPLVVSELAEAVKVPHAHPLIGVVKDDPLLGEFNKTFAGKVCLIEEREPMGKSENSQRMFSDLNEDNDNNVDGEAFLRARLLDLLIDDWDRHPDQWRWVDMKKGRQKFYTGIPRDRDQAFYMNQGVFPHYASMPWVVPILQGFEGKIKHPKYSLKEGAFLGSRPALQMTYDRWMNITNEFIAAIPDEVIEKALLQLPPASWQRGHEKLLATLKERRDNIPAAMSKYYHFLNRVVYIQLSNKNELISIKNDSSQSLLVHIQKKGKKGEGQTILSKLYEPGITKEIRIYTGEGNDSVIIDNNSPISIRVIGGEGNKVYNIIHSSKKTKVYDKEQNAFYYGETDRLIRHSSDDSANTAFTPANRYNVFKPLVGLGLNRDDGFILGIGFQYFRQGFRKTPYASMNRLMLYHSFATSAFKIKYSGEWLNVFGKTDFVASADIFAPQNIQNFFGRGNETPYDKNNDISFYRARFSLFQFAAGARWRDKIGVSFSVGPALQRYSFDSSDNKGRIINYPSFVKSYDSATISKSKTHAGVIVNLIVNKRNNLIIPSKGYYFNVKLQGYAGANKYSESFAQLIPEFSVYAPLNKKHTIVLAERVGGGISVGKTTFYQSLFAGGHENLLGYRQYRFAGEHSLYNNLELRMRIANFTGYIVPGEFGFIGFYDLGRVWVKEDDSNTWHHGTGGGLYFAPAKLAVLSVVAGYSKEGWYPYVTVGFRF
jgi:hypothetical protein